MKQQKQDRSQTVNKNNRRAAYTPNYLHKQRSDPTHDTVSCDQLQTFTSANPTPRAWDQLKQLGERNNGSLSRQNATGSFNHPSHKTGSESAGKPAQNQLASNRGLLESQLAMKQRVLSASQSKIELASRPLVGQLSLGASIANLPEREKESRSALSAKRKEYRHKSYVTSYANSDTKLDKQSSNEGSSVSPGKEYLQRTCEKQNVMHAFQLTANEMFKASSAQRDSNNQLSQNPYSQLVTTSCKSQRYSGHQHQTLDSTRRKLQFELQKELTSNRKSNKSSRTNQMQELKIEDLMQTPKRTVETAFHRTSKLSITEQGVSQHSEEDVDGAQAIENESDFTEEVDGVTCTTKSLDPMAHHMHTPSLLKSMAMPKYEPVTYSHDESSFGVSRQPQPGQIHIDRQLEDDSAQTIQEEPRRGRAMRQASIGRIFSKASAVPGESSSILVDDNQVQGPHHNRLNSYQNFNLEQESPEADNCTTDEEIFDQDGAANYIDLEDAEDTKVEGINETSQPSSSMHGMVGFRQHQQARSYQQPLTSYGMWVQEPHIDEEISEAEEDNSSENKDTPEHRFELPNQVHKMEIQEMLSEDGQVNLMSAREDYGRNLTEEATDEDIDFSQQSPVTTSAAGTAAKRLGHKSESNRSKFIKNNIKSAAVPANRITAIKATESVKKGALLNGAHQSKATKNGYTTPMEMGSYRETTSSMLPPKVLQGQKKKQQTVTRQRIKTQAFGQMKISSIDFSNPALSPKRNTLFEGSSYSDALSQSQKGRSKKEDRGTPRQQPITNFQLQQEQAKLMKNRQAALSQKMNHTAFGSSSILAKSSKELGLVNNQPSEKAAGKLTAGGAKVERKDKAMVSTSHLLNFQNSVGQTFQTKTKKDKVTTVCVQGTSDSLHNDKDTSGSKSTSKSKAKSGSIFKSARGNTVGGGHGHQSTTNQKMNIKPFSLDGHHPHDHIGNSKSFIQGTSPEKRGYSRQTAQSYGVPTTSKTVKTQKEKPLMRSQMLQGADTSSTILNGHLQKLQAHQQSLKDLHSIQSLSKSSIWHSTAYPMQKQGLATSVADTVADPSTEIKSKSDIIVNKKSSDHGFISHTAARASAKRGFFKENGGTVSSSAAHSIKASAAVLPDQPVLTMTSVDATKTPKLRSNSKQKKKSSQQKQVSSAQTTIAQKIKQNSFSAQTSGLQSLYTTSVDVNQHLSSSAKHGNVAGMKPQDSVTSLKPKASQKQLPEQSQIIFSGSTRQRTLTTLQQNKSCSNRASTSNLTLHSLMSSQVAPSATATNLQKSQKVSTRGATQGSKHAAASSTNATSQSFSAAQMGGGLKASQQIVKNSVLSASTKSSKEKAITGVLSGKTSTSERMEILKQGATAAGKPLPGKKGTVNQSVRGTKRPGDVPPSGTKQRSQSTLKLNFNSENQNTSLMNFSSQPGHDLGQRKSNAQHSVILAAATAEHKTSRASASNNVPGGVTRNINERKRQSVQHTSSASTRDKEWGLADFEKATYGDRCPKGYEKLSLLGKGGCAVVWLAREMHTGRQVALKQFPKPKNASGQTAQGGGVLDPTAKIEIATGKLLFAETNSAHSGYSIDPVEFPGILKIARLYAVLEETKDVWLAYQVGGKCLTDLLFDVKGEFYKGERIYGVTHQGFYSALKNDKQVIVDLIRMLAQVFDVLAMFRIVHADIKPDNILVDFDGRRIKDIKLIDFGSAFSYESPSNISATTPEYLAPEVLDYLERRGQNTDSNGTNSTNLCRQQEPWSYDMWSMGAILLEMLTGIPLWMSLKCRAHTQTGKQLFGMGILGVQGRQGKKILQKQSSSLKNLQATLKKYECYGLDKDPVFMDLLVKMLDPNPIQRISPIEVLEHPFIKNNPQQAYAGNPN